MPGASRWAEVAAKGSGGGGGGGGGGDRRRTPGEARAQGGDAQWVQRGGRVAGSSGAGPQQRTARTEYFTVEQDVVGLLIGKGGETILALKKETGVDASFDQTTKGDGYSILKLHGGPEVLSRAKAFVEYNIGELGDRWKQTHQRRPADVGHSSGGGQVNPGADSAVVKEVRLGQSVVGLVIGGGGETLRSIERQTGAHLKMDQSTRARGFSTLRISGSATAVEAAQQLVATKTTEDDATNPEMVKDTDQLMFRVDQKDVGIIIGRNGEALRAIEQETGVWLNVDQSTRDLGYSVVKASGDAAKILYARNFIADKVKAMQKGSSAEAPTENGWSRKGEGGRVWGPARRGNGEPQNRTEGHLDSWLERRIATKNSSSKSGGSKSGGSKSGDSVPSNWMSANGSSPGSSVSPVISPVRNTGSLEAPDRKDGPPGLAQDGWDDDDACLDEEMAVADPRNGDGVAVDKLTKGTEPSCEVKRRLDLDQPATADTDTMPGAGASEGVSESMRKEEEEGVRHESAAGGMLSPEKGAMLRSRAASDEENDDGETKVKPQQAESDEENDDGELVKAACETKVSPQKAESDEEDDDELVKAPETKVDTQQAESDEDNDDGELVKAARAWVRQRTGASSEQTHGGAQKGGAFTLKDEANVVDAATASQATLQPPSIWHAKDDNAAPDVQQEEEQVRDEIATCIPKLDSDGEANSTQKPSPTFYVPAQFRGAWPQSDTHDHHGSANSWWSGGWMHDADWSQWGSAQDVESQGQGQGQWRGHSQGAWPSYGQGTSQRRGRSSGVRRQQRASSQRTYSEHGTGQYQQWGWEEWADGTGWDHDATGRMSGTDDWDEQEIEVPQQFVGCMIGKGGMTIDVVADQTGARLSFNQKNHHKGFSTLSVSGTAAAVRKATKVMKEKMAELVKQDAAATYGSSSVRLTSSNTAFGHASHKLLKAVLSALLGKWHTYTSDGVLQHIQVEMQVVSANSGAQLLCSWTDSSNSKVESPIRFDGADVILGKNGLYLDVVSEKQATWMDCTRPDSEQCYRWTRGFPKREAMAKAAAWPELECEKAEGCRQRAGRVGNFVGLDLIAAATNSHDDTDFDFTDTEDFPSLVRPLDPVCSKDVRRWPAAVFQ